jgi:hypothetical protein
VDQITEIVGEAGEQANFGSHDISVDSTGRERGYGFFGHEIWR